MGHRSREPADFLFTERSLQVAVATRSLFCKSLECWWPLCRAPELSVCRWPSLGHRAGASRGLWQPWAGSFGLLGSLRFTNLASVRGTAPSSAGPTLHWSTDGVSRPAASCSQVSPAFNHVHCCSGRGLGVERNACMVQMVPSSSGAELSGEW